MKKLILSLAFFSFVAFGALSIQHVIASSSQVEVVNFDKDPKKEDNKKASETKEVKADGKTGESGSKSCASSCASSCADKSASKDCCAKDKAACCSSPDKK